MNDDELRRRLRRGAARPNPAQAQDLLDRTQRRTHPSAYVAAALLVVSAGLGLLALRAMPDQPRLAMKGTASPTQLSLLWVAEGDGNTRASVRSLTEHQRVVFGTRGGFTGFACLEEQQPNGSWLRVLPPPGASWPVAPGEALFQLDGVPQSFRTDLDAGARSYRLLADSVSGDCSGAEVVAIEDLVWLP